MRILIIGANGTIGKRLTPALAARHSVFTAGRSSGEFRVDIHSVSSITELFRSVKSIDACICIAASGPMDNFATLTSPKLLEDMQAKLFGQINLVLLGQHWINSGGSFTLTSGIFADLPFRGVTGSAITSGALHSFTLSAALELKSRVRVNCVSPGMAADSAGLYSHLFPGLAVVPMERLVGAYIDSVESTSTGQVYRVY